MKVSHKRNTRRQSSPKCYKKLVSAKALEPTSLESAWSSDIEPSLLLLEDEELLAADRFSREGGALVTEEVSASLSLVSIGNVAAFLSGWRPGSSARNTESRLTSTGMYSGSLLMNAASEGVVKGVLSSTVGLRIGVGSHGGVLPVRGGPK